MCRKTKVIIGKVNQSGLESHASAACKPQGNQYFTIQKISWNSEPDLNMAISKL